jgi:hypothetical protein
MSGFLNNQVAKTLDATPAVRPRLPSLFELPGVEAPLPTAPSPGETDLEQAVESQDARSLDAPPARPPGRGEGRARPAAWPADDMAEDNPASIPAQRAAAPARARLDQPPPSPALTSPAGWYGEAAAHAPQPSAPLGARSEAGAARGQLGDPSPPATIQRVVERVLVPGGELATPAHHAEPQPAVRPIQPRLAPHQPLLERHPGLLVAFEPAGVEHAAPPHEAADDQIKVAGREQLVVSAPAPAAPRLAERTLQLERQIAAPTLPAPPAAEAGRSAAVVAQPRIIRYADSARPAAEAAPPAPAATIQVTIGRIEVRATPQARPPAPARQGPAAARLDEYLRQRSRGGGG